MGFPSITNVGGSLTSAAALTLLAWAVRFFRAAAQQRKQHQREPEDRGSSLRLGKYFCSLTPAAVKSLVDTDPIPNIIVDVRKPDEVAYNPLPQALMGGVNIPVSDVQQALAKRAAGWQSMFPETPAPAKSWLLVFVSDDMDAMRAAAAAAVAVGYEHTAVLEGGVQALSQGALQQREPKQISRDALAALLGVAGERGARAEGVRVLDVRRHDECVLYGSIPGTVHVPADQLPAALKMAPRDWEQVYRSTKPCLDDWLVMQCRDNKRATWAAQIAQDQGWPRVLVHREGVYGWRVHPAVRSYASYKKGEPPPEPEPFQSEPLDAGRSKFELAQLGMRSL
ncbi:hypothetical protein CVIRNUC_008169 [Coccomyxa viridis]|uniref:Rhodanese domain-containing protein n=1 Tax=Coccomyxa viridis TaxID=1274662 RepID=A0AAV1IC84_9CHLO|nr:hypothetical protein CVIRNUC_008169 [Coccomyxa viridis]